jgi:hypothetical protein
VKFGAFSLIDGNYNEFMESDSVSICDMPKSDNPLVAFIYKEMMKAGNVVRKKVKISLIYLIPLKMLKRNKI